MAPKREFDTLQATILRRAQALKGGAEAFANYLHAELEQLEAWTSGTQPPPEAIFEKALDLVVEWKLSQRGRG